MDSYKKQDNKVFFKTHFWILNSFLYGAKLTINAIINFNANILRHLDSIERNIDCTQYFDNDYPVYLINFQCAFDFDNSQSLKSIKPNSFIINGNKDIDIQNNQTKDITIEELSQTSLESEYENYSFNKFKITTINDIKLQKQLTFNIKGEFDTKPKNDDQYNNIIIKKNNNQQITGNCEIKANSDYLSCSFSKDNIKNKETLEIEEGMYKAEQNKEILIISNLNNKKINVPKKSISVGAIVGITIAGIVILIPIIFFLAKYLMSKNENNGMNQYNERELQIARNEIVYNNMNSNDNSKQVIYN